jgi:tetratricopeptide (TPR) repeat protein
MHHYGVREVEKLLGLSRSTLRSLINAGFVAPARGPRNALQFCFRDLIVLRTAQALAAAKLPHRRIVRALRELRARLPDEMPMSGLSIAAFADQVVVREGGSRWQAESGQYLLSFEGDPEHGQLRVVQAIPAPAPPAPPSDWHAQALATEADDPRAAATLYRRAIEAEPARLEARINLGRLLHEMERNGEALDVYLEAAEQVGVDALLHFNLAVLLDDLDRKDDAVRAYEAALQADPRLADGHYNLSLLYEELGKPREAIRHMAQYRRLVGKAGA